MPCDVPSPDGAFYYLVRVHSRMDSMTLAERLIREHRIATIPGSASRIRRPALCASPTAPSTPSR